MSDTKKFLIVALLVGALLWLNRNTAPISNAVKFITAQMPKAKPFDYVPSDYGPPRDYNEDALGGLTQPCNACSNKYFLQFFSTPQAQAEWFAKAGVL